MILTPSSITDIRDEVFERCLRWQSNPHHKSLPNRDYQWMTTTEVPKDRHLLGIVIIAEGYVFTFTLRASPLGPLEVSLVHRARMDLRNSVTMWDDGNLDIEGPFTRKRSWDSKVEGVLEELMHPGKELVRAVSEVFRNVIGSIYNNSPTPN